MDSERGGFCWSRTKRVRKVVKLARKRRDTPVTMHTHLQGEARQGKRQGKARIDTDGPISRSPPPTFTIPSTVQYGYVRARGGKEGENAAIPKAQRPLETTEEKSTRERKEPARPSPASMVPRDKE